jgi:hypothetical protein
MEKKKRKEKMKDLIVLMKNLIKIIYHLMISTMKKNLAMEKCHSLLHLLKKISSLIINIILLRTQKESINLIIQKVIITQITLIILKIILIEIILTLTILNLSLI